MSNTVCIVPWTSLVIGPDGRATFCCDAPDPIQVNGRMGTVYQDSIADLWNAPDLVRVRAAMARGEKPDTCEVCWRREQNGGISRRFINNGVQHWLGGPPLDTLVEDGATDGYRLDHGPSWWLLELGNVCNLKCRSCSPLFSSRIAGDRVQAAWTLGTGDGAPPPRERLRIVPENGKAWYQDVQRVADMVTENLRDQATLSLLGGEPFLAEVTWPLLREFVARGVAGKIYVGFSTNGQHRNAALAELAPRFRGVSVSVSIDGQGKLYEYLRHGGSWARLLDNLRWLRGIPGVAVVGLPTLQNVNALSMAPLLRFLDEQKIGLAYNAVAWPARLHVANLPPSVRRIAVRRLQHYLDEECPTANLAIVRSYCEELDSAEDRFDEELFAEFMAFTNDLDADRGESIRDAAPELVALVRAAGIPWADTRRHTTASSTGTPLVEAELLTTMNRSIATDDATFAIFEQAGKDTFFTTAARQVAAIDAGLRELGHEGLAGSHAVADYACHYGRMTRALRAALPQAAVYACDIDPPALEFCARELGALPVRVGWCPDEQSLPGELDAIVCISLLTHTPLDHWRRTLRAWSAMLKPGGALAFTILTDDHLAAWNAGAMPHYGRYTPIQREEVARTLREEGFGFAAIAEAYGDSSQYGVAFATREVVERELAAAGLELLAMPADTASVFAQDLVLVRKPEVPLAETARSEVRRDVTVVALYDPRCYAPERSDEGLAADSAWAQLASSHPRPPLPTELGFTDPRVAEVREAQAKLAAEHGIDAFCYRYFWGPTGPRWDAPWRELVATGRPDLTFAVMLDTEGGPPLSGDEATRFFEAVASGLGAAGYLRVDGDHRLLAVRDLGSLSDPRGCAAAWREAAAAHGISGLHLCAGERAGMRPADVGFDSFFEVQVEAGERAAAALVRPWPSHRFFRTVPIHRDASEPYGDDIFEHWLHATCAATRQRGEQLVFVDAWNDWRAGRYLEPDDHTGLAALQATRRATRGPASGLALLRRLRDAIGPVTGPAAAALDELTQVVALHERGREGLLASIEVALGRNRAELAEPLHSVPIPSRQLPASGGVFCLDRVGGAADGELRRGEPVPLVGSETHIAGWAHVVGSAPSTVDLYVALEARSGPDYIILATDRMARSDVTAAFPGYPDNCGFQAIIDLSRVAAGVYDLAIVQRTASGTYRDATGVSVCRD